MRVVLNTNNMIKWREPDLRLGAQTLDQIQITLLEAERNLQFRGSSDKPDNGNLLKEV